MSMTTYCQVYGCLNISHYFRQFSNMM